MDPILVSVIANRLHAIGRQMGAVIEHSAHSPLLVEGRDFSLGIYDASGRLIEQTEYIPVLGYATAPGVQAVVEYFRGEARPGDVILHNDTFSGGNQLSDWKVVRPVFWDRQLVAWTAVSGHQADVGGAVPGSYNPNATDLWQEALRITPVKIVEGGVPRRDVWDLIFGNVRLAVVADDIQAMIGGCTVGERELHALFRQYGVSTVQEAVEEVLEATERMTRQIIREIPNGRYCAQWWVRDDAFDHEARMNINLALTVEDDRLVFDFSGTHPQTPGYVNAPLPVTLSAVMISFFMLAGREIPHNDAVMRCIEVIVPEGSMLNPRFPAATGFGNHLSDQICSVIMLALAEALPERITAGWNPLLASIISGQDPRRGEPYVDIMINACKGGSGGTYGADGYDHIGLIASGGAIAAQDPEMFEVVNPHVLYKYEYLPDSAGAGQWRGGLGVETVFAIEGDDVQISVFGDGVTEDTAAPGVLGGKPGCPNRLELHFPDGRVHVAQSKELLTHIPRGTVYRQIAGGGGGYGDPRRRSAELVAREVRDGLLSPEAALGDYGVVLADPADGLVDWAATERLRAAPGIQ